MSKKLILYLFFFVSMICCSILGNQTVFADPDFSILKTVPNKHTDTNYITKLRFDDYGHFSQVSGNLDKGTITIKFVADEVLPEFESLVKFLGSFNDYTSNQEDCTNIIFKSLVKLLQPRYLEVRSDFSMTPFAIKPKHFLVYGKPETKWEKIAQKTLYKQLGVSKE